MGKNTLTCMHEHNSENLERLHNSNCIKVTKKGIIKQ